MDVYANSKHLTKLMAMEESPEATERMLVTFSVGMYSKHMEVAEWVIRLTSKIVYDLYELGLLRPTYDWAVGETNVANVINGGLMDGLVFIMLKHNQLDHSIADLLIQLGREKGLNDVLNKFRDQIPNTEGTKPSYDQLYAQFLIRLLKPISVHRMCPELMGDTNVMSRWIDVFSRMAENARGPGEKGAALTLLVELWILFPSKILIDVQKYIINMLKRSTREKNIPLQVFMYIYIYIYSSYVYHLCSIYLRNLPWRRILLHLLYTNHLHSHSWRVIIVCN